MTDAVLDTIPYMIWTYDERGALSYVNAAWIAYTGFTFAESVEFADWNALLVRSDGDDFTVALRHALDTGVPFRREIKLKHRLETSDSRWHLVRVQPTVARDGSIVSWIGTALDIEDLKRAERASLRRELQYRQERLRSTMFARAALPPNLPAVAGLSFDAIYEPGLSDVQVGGDWYDALRLLDGRVVLSIGDVAGSGLHAAVIMGIVRQILRGIAQLHAEPALMLDAADRALRLEHPDVFVTAWVGIFDLVARTLTYASAGHPPPLLLRPDGDVIELNHRTLPIGLRQGHQGHATTIPIPHGSAVWLYTDGLIEASHNVVDGSRRLLEAASLLGPVTTRHPAAAIRREVIPDGAQDDVAILVVKADLEKAERFLARSHFDSGDAEAGSKARRDFAASLPANEFSEVDIANAEVVFGELCGNVARYAPGQVDIIVDSSGEQTVLHVLDRGVGFQHLSRLPTDPFAERGRGLYIIAAMTTEFTLTQRPGGGTHARAVLVGRYPTSLLREGPLPAISDQVATII